MKYLFKNEQKTVMEPTRDMREVCLGQIHQDVVDVEHELLVVYGAGNRHIDDCFSHIDGGANNVYKHCIEGA